MWMRWLAMWRFKNAHIAVGCAVEMRRLHQCEILTLRLTQCGIHFATIFSVA